MSDLLIGANFGDDESESATDLDASVAAAAAGPKQASSDGQSYTAQSIDDIIKAANYLNAKKHSRRKLGGIKLSVARSPGATG